MLSFPPFVNAYSFITAFYITNAVVCLTIEQFKNKVKKNCIRQRMHFKYFSSKCSQIVTMKTKKSLLMMNFQVKIKFSTPMAVLAVLRLQVNNKKHPYLTYFLTPFNTNLTVL